MSLWEARQLMEASVPWWSVFIVPGIVLIAALVVRLVD